MQIVRFSLIAFFALAGAFTSAAYAAPINQAMKDNFGLAVAACGAYLATGASTASLEAYGFRKTFRRHLILVDNENVIGKTSVSAAAKRNECEASMSGVRRNQLNEIFALAEMAMQRSGFVIKTRTLKNGLAEKYFVRGSLAIRMYASQGGDETKIVFKIRK